MSRLRDWFARTAAQRQHKPNSSASADGVANVIAKALSAAGLLKTAPTTDDDQRHKDQASHQSDGKQFFWDTCGQAPDALDFKVYLPTNFDATSQPRSLIVMLHGCTQDPDDFATGTRMNELAERHGFIVAYPQQPSSANSSKCWNWFRPEDQRRDSGEPHRIAAMVRELIVRYSIDRNRVYVAGMSAGAAMAVILARTYPDLFAAVGVHSGLPYGSANNVVSALAVMKNARVPNGRAKSGNTSRVPAIIFHGDRDATVNHDNADALVQQVLADWPTAEPLSLHSSTHVSEGGRVCDRLIYKNPRGIIAVDYWTIHGGGHLWSGGNPRGSHTEASGPDASLHFYEFFLAHAGRLATAY